jgi:hypothetical protein
MNKQDVQFEIDQLRKDKIIYAVESTSATLATMLLLSYKIESSTIYGMVAILGALGYWVFTVYGNTRRLIKIKELEKKLYRK